MGFVLRTVGSTYTHTLRRPTHTHTHYDDLHTHQINTQPHIATYTNTHTDTHTYRYRYRYRYRHRHRHRHKYTRTRMRNETKVRRVPEKRATHPTTLHFMSHSMYIHTYILYIHNVHINIRKYIHVHIHANVSRRYDGLGPRRG